MWQDDKELLMEMQLSVNGEPSDDPCDKTIANEEATIDGQWVMLQCRKARHNAERQDTGNSGILPFIGETNPMEARRKGTL
jgi:hypothetical protein